MPRSKEVNQHILDMQREKIIAAARRVFAHKGLDATMDDVALEAGISHGLAYRYFASKQALFAELVSRDLSAQSGWLEEFSRAVGQPMQKIRQMVSGFAQSHYEHPEHYRLLAQVLTDDSVPGDLRERVAARGQAVRALLRELIVAGQAAGEVASGSPDQLARAVLAALEGLTAWHAASPSPDGADFPDPEILLRMLKPELEKTN
jgi:AcrR family transcriptional regulator